MKIVKFFVVFNLILSISLINSVAAISVSDGSAFVTKAEFAADLNNLSNRMSTLENSLDAKIDSLVSSYLSRNGIWNGEKQEILNYWTIKGSTYVQFPLISPSNTITDLKYVKVADKVFTASKSGLLFAHFGLRISNGYLRTSNGLYTYFLSTAIAPVGSKWVGDFDGVVEDFIAYEYKRNYIIDSAVLNVAYDLQGFVTRGVDYSIYVSSYTNQSSFQVESLYTDSYRGFKPSFDIY